MVETEDADNTAHARCILDKYAYTHARIRLRSCFHIPPPFPLHTYTRTRTHKHALTHTQICITDFHCNSDFVNAPLYYVTRTLPLLLYVSLTSQDYSKLS